MDLLTKKSLGEGGVSKFQGFDKPRFFWCPFRRSGPAHAPPCCLRPNNIALLTMGSLEVACKESLGLKKHVFLGCTSARVSGQLLGVVDTSVPLEKESVSEFYGLTKSER
jgi:hypothetical protein